MPIVPFRNLADQGILTDPSPYELPANAWSGGNNIRFNAKKAERAPIFREVKDALTIVPQFMVAYQPASEQDAIILVNAAGTVHKIDASGAETDVTPTSGITPSTASTPWTTAQMGDVVYLNNPAFNAPMSLQPTDTIFRALPNWPTATTARVFRAYSDYLIAMNVTEGSNSVPQMVKWSDLTLAGQVPDSWDPTDATKSAGENVLEQLTSPIVDGLPLRGAFIIYSSDQVWLMELSGTIEIFQWQPIFSSGGIINTNCVVEVDGKHYVFGQNDIYVHDGSEKQSIAQDRVKDSIYANLNRSLQNLCFVQHMPEYSEVMFAFVSGDSGGAYPTLTTGCNRGAVYNYAGNTWSFRDLPALVAGGVANVNRILTWAEVGLPDTWGNFGGTWYSQRDGLQLHTVFAGQAVSGLFANSRVYGYDFINRNSTLSFPTSMDANAPAFLLRTGLALDDEGSDLQTYKMVRRFFPQVGVFGGDPIQIKVGGQEFPSGPITWSPLVNYDPTSDYKVDLRIGGRYLAVEFTVPETTDFEVAGFDLDVYSAGSR